MSRNFIPALFAIGVGVFSGYYTFNPTFQQLQYEKSQASKSSSPSEPSASQKGPEPSSQASSEQGPKSSTQ
ncbi:uncharacterized protein N7529_010034 [Penicillium soppii]|uniref:uncharacterized protein n=1 Tax=Penicillium soppii TaxID=69789 RepID=UPI0025484EF4|nr:uncharacterized protein N7529_010034 [Penicillium soppii]KAJ5856090.1 hypothetical protein N7529_010034 [Penicillium soppii]